MNTIWPGMLVGVVVGVVVAVATQLLAHALQYSRGVMEKRLALYLELMTLASDELFRNSQVQTLCYDHKFLTTEDGKKWWAGVEGQRHANRRDLARVVSKLQLVERDKLLRERLKALPKNQPFFRPLSSESPIWKENIEKYEQQTRDFEKEVSEIAETILKRHPWLEAFAAMVRWCDPRPDVEKPE
jgi:hypothetical protein